MIDLHDPRLGLVGSLVLATNLHYCTSDNIFLSTTLQKQSPARPLYPILLVILKWKSRMNPVEFVRSQIHTQLSVACTASNRSKGQRTRGCRIHVCSLQVVYPLSIYLRKFTHMASYSQDLSPLLPYNVCMQHKLRRSLGT